MSHICCGFSQPGLSADVEEKKVDNARRILGAYWAELFEYYDIGCLPAGSWIPHWVPRGPFWIPKNMLTGNFLRKAVKFMLVIIPPYPGDYPFVDITASLSAGIASDANLTFRF